MSESPASSESRRLPARVLADGDGPLAYLDAECDPTRLRKIARLWLCSDQPETRIVLDYLARPPHPFHAPLVHGLVQLATRRGHDYVAAALLVWLDRSVRRPRGSAELAVSGLPSVEVVSRTHLFLTRTEETWRLTGLREPAPAGYAAYREHAVAARSGLRRKLIGYFRCLGRHHPERFVRPLGQALLSYTDDDTKDTRALNRVALIHFLFGRGKEVVRAAGGWELRGCVRTDDLSPAPPHEALWAQAPLSLFDLAAKARSSLVRNWAANLLLRQDKKTLLAIPADDVLALAARSDAWHASLGSALLRARGLDDLTAEQLANRVGRVYSPEGRAAFVGVAGQRLKPGDLDLARAAMLARTDDPGMTDFAWRLLRPLRPKTAEECWIVLTGTMDFRAPRWVVEWTREALADWPEFHRTAVFRLLTWNQSAEVRKQAWAWMTDDPALRHDVGLWCRLNACRHHHDLTRWLTAYLSGLARTAPSIWSSCDPADSDVFRGMAADLLLRTRKGGRPGQRLVKQLADRLDAHPEEARAVVPLLAEAVRVEKGPTWAMALAAVTRAIDREPALEADVRAVIPNYSPHASDLLDEIPF